MNYNAFNNYPVYGNPNAQFSSNNMLGTWPQGYDPNGENHECVLIDKKKLTLVS
jgi:hypothetical protein